jgi:hypothetical protein
MHSTARRERRSRGTENCSVPARSLPGSIEKWSKKHAKDFFEDTGLRLRKRWPLSLVAQAALKKHPLLQRLNEPIKGRKRDWSDLMWVESQAILKTMLDLKRKYKVPSYPVHDSLIVPKSKAARAVAQLGAHYFGELRGYHFSATLLDLKVSTRPVEPKSSPKNTQGTPTAHCRAPKHAPNSGGDAFSALAMPLPGRGHREMPTPLAPRRVRI